MIGYSIALSAFVLHLTSINIDLLSDSLVCPINQSLSLIFRAFSLHFCFFRPASGVFAVKLNAKRVTAK